MSIRDAARQAWLDSQQSLEGEARAKLAEVLAPFDVATLETVGLSVTDAWARLVVADPQDGTHLSVTRGDGVWKVDLVEFRDGDVDPTRLERVTSLAGLHKLLPPAVPEWAVGLSVSPGERYLYDTATYEAVQGHVTQSDWTPPQTPALWAKA